MLIKCFSHFKKSEIKDIEKVDSLLTMKNPEYATKARFGNHFTELPDEYLVYAYNDESTGEVLLPRNFHLAHPELFTIADERLQLTDGKLLKSNAAFLGELRKYQDDYARSIDFKTYRDLLYEVPCGHGKTILGFYNIIKRGVSAIVLVPTYQIAQQWLDTGRELTNLRVLIAEPAKFNRTDFRTIDVLILSFDLFDARKDKFPADFSKMFGHVLLDEAHTVGAPTYQPVLEIVPCLYRTALTATFRRSDGMDAVLQYHFGKRYTMQNQFQKPVVRPVQTGFKWQDTYLMQSIRGGKKNHAKYRAMFEQWLGENTGKFFYHIHGKGGQVLECDAREMLKVANVWKGNNPDETLLIRKICKDIFDEQKQGKTVAIENLMCLSVKRNRPIMTLIRNAIDGGRKVLVISKRKAHLQRMHREFTALGYPAGIIIGGDKQSRDRDYLQWINEKANPVFGIYQLAKQGLDIPNLDTLALIHPSADIEQPGGRINRLLTGKKAPEILYPMDAMRYNENKYMQCQRITRNCDFLLPSSYDDLLTVFPPVYKNKKRTENEACLVNFCMLYSLK